MNKKPSKKVEPKVKPPKDAPNAWTKEFLPDQGPKINGSSLSYTSCSDKSMRMPEARA